MSKTLFLFLHSQYLNALVVFLLTVFFLHKKPYFLFLALTLLSSLSPISLFSLYALYVKELLTFSHTYHALFHFFLLNTDLFFLLYWYQFWFWLSHFIKSPRFYLSHFIGSRKFNHFLFTTDFCSYIFNFFLSFSLHH